MLSTDLNAGMCYVAVAVIAAASAIYSVPIQVFDNP